MSEFVFGWVRALAKRLNLLELVEPELIDVFVERQKEAFVET